MAMVNPNNAAGHYGQAGGKPPPRKGFDEKSYQQVLQMLKREWRVLLWGLLVVNVYRWLRAVLGVRWVVWQKRLMVVGIALPTLFVVYLVFSARVSVGGGELVVRVKVNDWEGIGRNFLSVLEGTGLAVVTEGGEVSPLVGMATRAARQYGIDPILFHALIMQESSWNSYAVSAKGAAGLTQLMAETARVECGLLPDERFDPEKNLNCGALYFSKQLKRFNYQVDLALAAYNAGPDRVAQLGRVPRIAETQQYVTRIMTSWNERVALGSAAGGF